MKQEVQYLLEIIKYILNNKISELVIPAKDMDWEQLIQLAKEHSILNFVYYGVDCLPPEHKPDDEQCNLLYRGMVNAVVRNYNQIEGAKELLEAFEQEGIYALAVKGICTKNHYPQTDLRTMGDIDILYQPQQDAKVKKVMKQLGYDDYVEGRQHDCYSRRPYLAVEMHRELVEADSIYSNYYEKIWERVKPKENCRYVQEMSLEDEYIYTLVHLARHFQNGGIGIRFVIDVYVYNHLDGMDWQYIEAELKKLKLWKFYENISRLAEMWFGTEDVYIEEDKKLLDKLATYIIMNGTFGTQKNAAAISVAKNGRTRFLWKTIFPNLRNMQSMFPWLGKWPVLLPYAWVLRGFRSVKSRRKNIKAQISKYKNGDKKYGKELQRFYEICGLRGQTGCEPRCIPYNGEGRTKTEVSFLLEIIKYILNGETGEAPLPEKNMSWMELLEVARRHSLAYVLYYGVECLPKEYKPDEEIYQYIQESGMYDLVISCNQIEAAKTLSRKFEENGVFMVAVKGICTKERYPQPELRSMGDIDILYQDVQHSKMKKIMSQLQYERGAEGRKHDHFYCEPYIQVEMHRELVATDSVYNSYYKQIWNKLHLRDNCQYVYEMSMEDEYIYTIIHLAEHFKNGGIGIRFIMDVFVYNNIKDMNWKYIEEELKKLDLWKFFRNISNLAEVWFGTGVEPDANNSKLLNELVTYIMTNGTFGTQKNAASLSIKNGRIAFLLNTVFPNLKNMQSMYPWLKKWPILLPFSWIIRGIRSVLFRRNHIKIYYEHYKYGDKKQGKELNRFFEACGL